MLILGVNIRFIFQLRIQKASGDGGQKFHREMDALEFSSGNLNVPGLRSAAAEQHPVKFLQQLFSVFVPSHIRSGDKGDPLLLQKADPAVQNRFIQLHIGDAVPQKAADAVASLKYGHLVAPAVQLHGRRQAGGAASHHRYLFSGPHLWRFRFQKSVFPGVFDHCPLVFFGGYRISVEAAGAGRLAESRADPGSKFRKTVGFGQPPVSLLPVSQIHQIVPFRAEILQGAAAGHTGDHAPGLAEGNAAGHAAGSLLSLFVQGERRMKFLKIFDPLQGRPAKAVLPLIF